LSTDQFALSKYPLPLKAIFFYIYKKPQNVLIVFLNTFLLICTKWIYCLYYILHCT